MLRRYLEILFLIALLAVPAASRAQQPNLTAPVPPPGETSSVTTIEGAQRTTTTCRTDTQRNTVCLNRSSPMALPSPAPPPPVSPLVRQELARSSELRQDAWESYCRPTPYRGSDGLTRYRYAHVNCDMVVLSGKVPRAPWAAAD